MTMIKDVVFSEIYGRRAEANAQANFESGYNAAAQDCCIAIEWLNKNNCKISTEEVMNVLGAMHQHRANTQHAPVNTETKAEVTAEKPVEKKKNPFSIVKN